MKHAKYQFLYSSKYNTYYTNIHNTESFNKVRYVYMLQNISKFGLPQSGSIHS